jgi:hypothetical protein
VHPPAGVCVLGALGSAGCGAGAGAGRVRRGAGERLPSSSPAAGGGAVSGASPVPSGEPGAPSSSWSSPTTIRTDAFRAGAGASPLSPDRS